MNSLEQMMGLTQQGYPNDMPYPDDPALIAGYMGDDELLMEQMGVPPLENPYELVGMEEPTGADPGYALAQNMLGGPPPQMSQDDINALAYSLGLGGNEGILVDDFQDKIYPRRVNTLSLMGGF